MTVSISIKPKAPAIPALLPHPDLSSPVYEPLSIRWARHSLNSDAKVQALESMRAHKLPCAYSSTANTKLMALTAGIRLLKEERDTDFLACLENGGLLFAWYGSRALVEPLPASLQQGGAA